VRKPTAQHVELCVQYTGWPEPLWMAATIATKRARAYKVFEHENAAAVRPVTAAAREAVLQRASCAAWQHTFGASACAPTDARSDASTPTPNAS
jgi:hypothetical protein